MNDYFHLSKYACSLIATALLMLAGARQASAIDRYEPKTRQLTVPSISIGAATYSNLVVTVASIVSGPSGVSPVGSADSYNPANWQLTVQSVTVGTTTYHNVIVVVANPVSIGSVSGADRFSDGVLSVPSLQTGEMLYYGVKLAIPVANVIGVAGGMPVAIRDQFDPASNTLVIPAVQVGSKVYTNVAVSAGNGNILSIGGKGSAGGGGNVTTFSVNSTAVSVIEAPTGSVPMPSVGFTITEFPSGGLYYGYKVAGGAVTGVTFDFSGVVQPDGSEKGSAELQFDSPYVQGSGIHASTVTLQICRDPQCQTQIAGSPQTIVAFYKVTGNVPSQGSWYVEPRTLNLESPSNGPAVSPKLTVIGYSVPPYGAYLYLRQSADGIIQSIDFNNTVNSGGYVEVDVSLNLPLPAELGPGIYNNTVTLDVCYDQACTEQAAGSPWIIPFAYMVTASEGREFQVRVLTLPATAIAADPAGTNLYVGTWDYSGGPQSPSLAKIDPASGATLATASLPGYPQQVVVSPDGAYAYVLVNIQPNKPRIERVNLSTMAVDLEIPFDQLSATVSDFAASPKASRTFAVAVNYSAPLVGSVREVEIFDDDVPRPNTFSVASDEVGADHFQWSADGSMIYICDTALYESAVTSTGLAPAMQLMPFFFGDGFDGHLHQLGGLLYSDGGAVVDPTNGTKLGQYVLKGPSNVSTNPTFGAYLQPDASTGRTFAVYEDSGFAGVLYTLQSFSLSQFSPIWIARSPVQLSMPVRWGTSGLAFLALVSSPSAQFYVYLINGSLVAPSTGTTLSDRTTFGGDVPIPVVGSFFLNGDIH